MAEKPKLGEVSASIQDPMFSDNYLLEIGSIPTAFNYQTAGDQRPMVLQCRTAAKPGVTIENVEVALFGHTLEYVGRKTFSHDMSVEFVENRDGQIQTLLESWAEFCRSTSNQLGAYKADYARTATLTIFDVRGETKLVYKIYGLWPSSIPEITFDGQGANLITLSVTFKYDYYSQDGVDDGAGGVFGADSGYGAGGRFGRF